LIAAATLALEPSNLGKPMGALLAPDQTRCRSAGSRRHARRARADGHAEAPRQRERLVGAGQETRAGDEMTMGLLKASQARMKRAISSPAPTFSAPNRKAGRLATTPTE
jgi:hypothetical protein